MSQEFGGIWTVKKLAVLDDYLNFYTNALKDQPFTLHYVDAFAGAGEHSPARVADQETLIPRADLTGSVETALSIDRPFDQYHFNEKDRTSIKELERIKAGHPNKKIEIRNEDANVFVPNFCAGMKWNDRAVLLLDPFSTQLDWKTLKPVSSTGKIDLWLLFPISVITRMTPRDGNRTKPEWKQTLDRLLGTNDWEEALYKPVIQTGDLFDDNAHVGQRVNVEEVGSWVTGRLKELFPFVVKPVLLKNNNRPLFLFYFAVSNHTDAARKLAQRATSFIVKKHNSN